MSNVRPENTVELLNFTWSQPGQSAGGTAEFHDREATVGTSGQGASQAGYRADFGSVVRKQQGFVTECSMGYSLHRDRALSRAEGGRAAPET